MTFSTYMFIGFIVTAIKAINSSIVYDAWNEGNLETKIGAIIGLLICVMIWPITVIDVVIGIFTSN